MALRPKMKATPQYKRKVEDKKTVYHAAKILTKHGGIYKGDRKRVAKSLGDFEKKKSFGSQKSIAKRKKAAKKWIPGM